MNATRTAIIQALARLLKPLVRLLLRQGVAYGEFAEVAKRAYAEVARDDFSVPGRKQSMSRIAVLTGIHRHEVGKLLKSVDAEEAYSAQHNRAARIITAWQTDDDFSNDGKPLVLDINEEFALLVSRHGSDVTFRAVLDELVRVGAVKMTGEDQVELLVEAFHPQHSHIDLLHIFGDSTADLLETLDHNLCSEGDNHRLQLSVVYDNLPTDALHNLELVSRERSMEFLKSLDRFFATQDRDSNPAVEGEGRNRAGVGLYYFQQRIEKDERT